MAREMIFEMNIGLKVQALFKSRNFKNYQEFGKYVGINGEWCLELSKKKDIVNVDITRLIKICSKFKVSMDWLLSDNKNLDIEIKEGYPEDDIGVMLDNINNKVKEESYYYGTKLTKNNSILIENTINEVKNLISDNL
jgi:hypothetical protein